MNDYNVSGVRLPCLQEHLMIGSSLEISSLVLRPPTEERMRDYF